jgi:hypothetical protein
MNVRLVHAILAGAQILTAGTTLADLLGARIAGAIVLVVGAVQGGVAAYQYGQASTPAAPAEPDAVPNAGASA